MLSSCVNRRNAGRFVPVVLAGLILAACSVNQDTQAPSATVQATANQGSAYYLQQMQHSQDDSRTHWQLLAIRALLDEGKMPEAAQQLQQLPHSLAGEQQVESHLLKAQYAISQQQFPDAARQLTALPVSQLNDNQRQRYYHLLIASAPAEAPIDLLRAYIALQPTLSAVDQQKNLDATWQVLVTIPQSQVGNITINANENILQGWLDLLGVYYQNRDQQDNLKRAVKDWQTRYPDNPASKTLPTGLLQVMNLSAASTNTIALLLPLTGPGAVFSKAIEQGFEDARNGNLSASVPEVNNAVIQAPQTQISPTANTVVSPSATSIPTQPVASVTPSTASPTASVPGTASANTAAQIKVYDTNGHPIDQLLQQAQQDGATLVVGPLLKEDVAKAVTTQTTLNILALNEPTDLQNHPNVCYFALSPENEARDAAQHMWAQGKRSPILLLPNNSLGDRVANAFTRQWQALGGSTVLRQTIGSESDLRSEINSKAGISLTGVPVIPATSQATSSSAITVAGMTFDAPMSQPVSSSGDVDSVYIVANQASLDLIKPLITMKIGSQSHVAFYANSLSSQAGAGPDFRFEMEGLQFSDIPLLSGANPALKQRVTAQFDQDYTLTRLYAMGVDAWTLANHFTPLRQQAGYQIQGNTGLLQATQNCVINRTLSWNQYTHGDIVPVN
ncbi:penicillin-binding protein activator [Rosenbergiella australiborealis]|uniref:Penicillin-binding protein activator LpoA n=1 Tax=Rosenbergiella australiborealis TaxID=1544696 RepID=A0ABS5T157_9GAMM|nr:penicillin-binding protein activator [Rosenbergiella australiborealis]MBT0726082.1 penicillin-binding protein activator [Rosenbergiella australiborealis]